MAFKFQVTWETKTCESPAICATESKSIRRKTEYWTIVHVRTKAEAEETLIETLWDEDNWPWWSDGNCTFALVDAHARAPRR